MNYVILLPMHQQELQSYIWVTLSEIYLKLDFSHFQIINNLA